MNIGFNSQNRVFEDISRIAVITYSPVPYIIPAFTITLGKLLNLSPLILIYIGRLANLLVWVFLTYLAIRIIPVHKWVLFMIALIPITLFEAASLSADSLILGLSFIIVAIFFKYAFDDNKEKINIKDIYILFILILLLSLSKQIYFLLLLLIFLIPSWKFGGRKKMFLAAGFLFLSVIIISGGWNLLVKDLYVPIVLFFTLRSSPVGLILLCFLVYYLYFIFSPEYSFKSYYGALCGLLGTLAYLTKSYALSFFIVHFILFNILHYLKQKNKRNILRNLFLGLAVFFIN